MRETKSTGKSAADSSIVALRQQWAAAADGTPNEIQLCLGQSKRYSLHTTPPKYLPRKGFWFFSLESWREEMAQTPVGESGTE